MVKKRELRKKRRQDQWSSSNSSSSSSDGRRCRSRCYHIRETSRANDEKPMERMFHLWFRDTMQDIMVSMEAKFEQKIEKLMEEGKSVVKEELRILKEGLIDRRILEEDLRILKEGQQDLKSKIQAMQKGGCAEVDHYRASPSQRSPPRLNLRIETILSSTIYKRETVTTKDGSSRIKVAMYDGGLPIASDHPLASVRVDLVIIEGRFNDKRDSWSREEFERSIITPREGIIRLVKNGTFDLIGGRCDHQGAIIMDNSQKKEVKLGVMIAVRNEERVLEGVSNPFKVQESKTKGSKKKNKKPSPPVPAPNLEQPTSTHATQHGQGPVIEQHSLSRPVIEDVLQKEDSGKHTEFLTDDTAENNGPSYPPATMQQMVEGNGQAQNNNGQNFRYGILEKMLGQSTSANPMQHGQVHTFPPPNDLEAAVGPYLSAAGQDHCTDFPIAALAHQNHSAYPTWDYTQLTPILQNVRSVEDMHVQTQMQGAFDGTFGCNRVLLQWDNPHVELKEHWNFLDQLMPLYSTKSRFYSESFPSTSLMDKAHKLLASISSGDYVSKMITSGTSQPMQTIQRRGVLIRPIGPCDSDDEPPVKEQRNAKYQLRFVNRVCSDYYTREQIKSEDGTFLKVALYDENNLLVTSGALSSACVEVVLLHGDFNAEGQDYWTSEEFSTCLVHPQSAKEPPALGGDRVLALSDGEADLGNVNFQTSSFHARTGKFKMGVVIKNVREQSVQEGITSPFLVRVRLGEEPSRHRITSLDALLKIKVKLPNQVCGALELDAKENVGSSSALHDQSSQVINVSGASTASNRPPKRPSPTFLDLYLGRFTQLKKLKSAEDIKDEKDGKYGGNRRPGRETPLPPSAPWRRPVESSGGSEEGGYAEEAVGDGN